MDMDEPNSEQDVFVYLAISAALVVFAGLMSGLTLGLMSFDVVDLEILMRAGSKQEQKEAKRVFSVVKHQHWLLVTLLVCNAGAMEALPLFIDRLVNPVVAIVLSVTVVLIFGEIIPQAVCHKYGLLIGAYSVPMVWMLMVVTAPISWTLGKVLDYLLGPEHTALFKRGQLKVLVDLHAESGGFGGVLSEQESMVMRGALDLSRKVAHHGMTPIDSMFMLSSDAQLSEETLQQIINSGHSRIPVHLPNHKNEIIGILLVKELILCNTSKHISDLKLRSLPRLPKDTPMYDLLRLFQTGRSHMVLLTENTGFHSKPVGVITIEDVLEELLQQEILDETDQFVDNLHTTRVNAALLMQTLPPNLKQILSQVFTPRIGLLAAKTGSGKIVINKQGLQSIAPGYTSEEARLEKQMSEPLLRRKSELSDNNTSDPTLGSQSGHSNSFHSADSGKHSQMYKYGQISYSADV